MSIDWKTEHAIISVIYSHGRFKYITTLHETKASIILTANQYCQQKINKKRNSARRKQNSIISESNWIHKRQSILRLPEHDNDWQSHQ